MLNRIGLGSTCVAGTATPPLFQQNSQLNTMSSGGVLLERSSWIRNLRPSGDIFMIGSLEPLEGDRP
jgi:hypothetical protein